MPLKFGSSSKASTFKRSAFPMQTGTINHSSALKAAEEHTIEKELESQYAQEQKEKKIQEMKNRANERGYEKYIKENPGGHSKEEWLKLNEEGGTTPSQIAEKNVEQKNKEIKAQEQKEKEEAERIKAEEAEEKKSHKTQKIEKKISKQKGKSKHSKLTEKITQGQSQLEVLNEKNKNLDPESNEYKKNQRKIERLNNKLRNWNEGLETASTKTKKGDRLKEKLAESEMYDNMSIQEKMAYKQQKRDQRDKNIRNTIATIDDIIPTQFGGGRGASKQQEGENLLKNYGNFSGKKSDTESATEDPPEEKGTLEQQIENPSTVDEVNEEKKNENVNKVDNENTDDPTYTDLESEKGDPYSYQKGSSGEYRYKKTDEDEDWTTAKGTGLEAIQERYGK